MNYRRITPNHSCEQPSLLVFFDCETVPVPGAKTGDPAEHHFRLAVARFYRFRSGQWRYVTQQRFDDKHELWQWIFTKASKKQVLWVFAHNAIFDLTVSAFWAYLDGREVEISCYLDVKRGFREKPKPKEEKWRGLVVIDERKLIIECCHENGRITLVDSMNYYRESLASVGESIGVPKLAMPPFEADDEEWFRYCENDVLVLSLSITKLMDEWRREDRGNWQPTAASLAWSNYRHRHLDRQITTHDDKAAAALEREAHIGGECRMWFRGSVLDDYMFSIRDFQQLPVADHPYLRGPVHHYDVNSLYPWIMCTRPMPVQLTMFLSNPSVDELRRLVERRFCIATVSVRAEVDRWPYREQIAGRPSWSQRILFPIGSFTTTLCGSELVDALNRGVVTHVHDVSTYATGRLFGSFVRYWYRVKNDSCREQNPTKRNLAKVMLNSLYGRFAMGAKRWELDQAIECIEPWGCWVDHDYDTGETLRCRGIAGETFVEREAPVGEHRLTAIAAAITSEARYYMRTVRDSLPHRSVLYQDTDSLMILDSSRSQFESLVDVNPSELGSFRHINSYECVEFVGPKNYTADGRNVIAGLPANAKKIGDRRFVGDAFENTASVLCRPCPDTIKVWVREADFSGLTGGDLPGRDGWTVPTLLNSTSGRKIG